jgi:glycolate oxidase FAD binding subunit
LSAQSVAATLARASQARTPVGIAGAGTKAAWGGVAPPAGVTISTYELNRAIEHRHGDLTATVPAGASLSDVNRELARHGQWIPLDPPWSDRATIGGIVATNDSGPRRHRFGAPRDLIIGVEVIRVDGTIAKSGGIVVKNVAGYDLGRLMTGSFGSLAVIASATFKLYPTSPASRTVVIELGDDRSAKALAERVLVPLTASHLTPSALEIASHPMRLLVRFESFETAAAQQADEAARIAVSNGATPSILTADDETALWTGHAQRPWRGDGAVIKVTCLPTDVGPTVEWLNESLSDVDWEVVGRAGLGVLLLRIGGDVPRQTRAIGEVRARFTPGRGTAVIVRASDDLKRSADVWGPPGDSLRLMRAIKQQFDPHRLLNPGRGPFGL